MKQLTSETRPSVNTQVNPMKRDSGTLIQKSKQNDTQQEVQAEKELYATGEVNRGGANNQRVGGRGEGDRRSHFTPGGTYKIRENTQPVQSDEFPTHLVRKGGERSFFVFAF